MRKIVPLLIMLWCGVVEAYGQAPEFQPYLAHVYTTEGFTVSLGADATGEEPITYRWEKEGTEVPGVTSDFYRIENVQMEDAGVYTLVATNANGSATATITLEVAENLPPSVILTGPGPSATFTPGTEFSFSADGDDPNAWSNLRFVWIIEYHDNGTVTPTDIAYLESPGENESAGYFHIPPDLEPSAGSFYRIRVTIIDHLDESATDYQDVPWSGELNTLPPEIEVQPQDLTVAANSPVTLSVDARFASSYQWRYEGSDIPGATSASYYISSVQPEHAGSYQVAVANAAGTTFSEEAVLTVIENLPPTITDQPDDVVMLEGSATFSVTASLATSYQWQLNGTNIPGATNATYRIEWVETHHEGTYKVIVSNPYGTVESEEAELTLSPPIITHHPENVTVPLDGPVEFSVTAQLAHTYQWKFDGVDIPGAVGPRYQIEKAQPTHAGRYSVVVTNKWGSTESNDAVLTVTVIGTVVIKTNPANLSVLVNEELVSTRYVLRDTAGTQVKVGPYSPQTASGVTYAFSNWSHGGSPNQNLIVPNTAAYYTINYSYPLTGSWRTTEVGAVNVQGSAAYTNGTYTLTASGNDIWHTSDAFRFVYQSYRGDVDIRARVTSLTNTHAWAKAGVMIRNSTDPKAKNVMTLISAGSGASFQRRSDAGGTTAATVVPASSPSWVRLVRNGNTFTSYISSNGVDWIVVGTPQTVTMNERVYIGLALTSHNINALATATFTNVSVSMPSTMAIAATENPTLDIYPNPVAGNTLQVKINGGQETRNLEIVNLVGRVMYQQEVSSAFDIDVDIQGLPQGVYVVRLKDNQGIQTRSLIRK